MASGGRGWRYFTETPDFQTSTVVERSDVVIEMEVVLGEERNSHEFRYVRGHCGTVRI